MIHIHHLDGCAPTPLAHYLKAIGILRLLAEQADSGVRGWWDGERFTLASTLDRASLIAFFDEQYSPTPLFNPWGARSGFFPGSSEKSARAALRCVLLCRNPRFSDYRKVYRTVCDTLNLATGGTKPSEKQKAEVIYSLRKAVRGKSNDWLDAVAAVLAVGETTAVVYPAIFGTGGSEGSGSYTSAYMEALTECLVQRKWSPALRYCIFGLDASVGYSWSKSAGQFAPESQISPWDIILAFEGGCMIRTTVNSRNDKESNRWASSPFFVAPTAAGYPTASRFDQVVINKSQELPGRGEQWFPLWSQPARIYELRQLLAEGRASTCAGKATEGWSLVIAAKTLGVNRGIREFVRYGYQQRNNLATHFAVPLGRCIVSDHINPRVSCLDDLAVWLHKLRRIARDKRTPSRFVTAERNLGHAFIAVSDYPDDPSRWQRLLLSIAAIESVMRTGTAFIAGPTPPLRPNWVDAAYDGTPECRLALALALQQGTFDGVSADWWNSVRRHWLPLDPRHVDRFALVGTPGNVSLRAGPEVVMAGRSGEADAIALVQRRLVEAAQHGQRRLPLQARPGVSARPGDLAALIAGGVDVDRTLALARALMALDAHQWRETPVYPQAPRSREVPDDGWLVVRLALLPPPRFGTADVLTTRADPGVFRRLAAGDAAGAVELALRRLRASGIRTAVRAANVGPGTARRWAAALAFPIDHSTATRFLERLDPARTAATTED